MEFTIELKTSVRSDTHKNTDDWTYATQKKLNFNITEPCNPVNYGLVTTPPSVVTFDQYNANGSAALNMTLAYEYLAAANMIDSRACLNDLPALEWHFSPD